MSTKHRSAKSGRYVTEKYADDHPDTTVKETDPPKPKGNGNGKNGKGKKVSRVQPTHRPFNDGINRHFIG